MGKIAQWTRTAQRWCYRAMERVWARYLLACAAVGAAFILRLVILPERAGFPYFTFYPAITFVALLTGVWPAVFAIALSGAICDYFFLEPCGSFATTPHGALSLLVFLSASLMLVLVVRMSRKSELEQARLAAIVNSSTGSIISKTLNGIITSWNPAAEEQFGYTAREAIGQPITMLFSEDRIAEEKEILAKVFRGEKVSFFETVRRRKDGSVFDASIIVSPIYDRGGRVIGASKILYDISEKKRLERTLKQSTQQLRESEQRYRSLVMASAQIVWTTDPSGRVIEPMPGWEEFTGQSFETYQGEGWLDPLHPEDRERAASEWRKALGSQSIYEMEYRLRRHDGVYRYFTVRGVPVQEADGTVREWIGTCMDVTARKQAEHRLQQAEERFRTIFESSPDAYFVFEEERGRIIDCNPAAERLLERERSGILGRSVADLSPARQPDGRLSSEAAREQIDQAIRNGIHRFEWTYCGTAKESFWVDVSLSTAWLEKQQVLLGVWRDIEERKSLEARLEQTIARLKESNSDLEEFAYVASHDLRAPLRAVDNLSQWLEEDLGTTLPAESAKHLQLMRGRVRRMEALLDGILEYSRAGRNSGVLEEINLTELTEEIAGADIAGRKVKARVDPPMVFQTLGIPFRQVMQNLIGNAVKHHDRDEVKINIEAEDKGAWYEFSVADDGPGIPEEFREKVFVLFQTLRPRDQVEASGIGLSIVKKLVGRYGGKIWIESAQPRGARFRLTWPKNFTLLKESGE